MEPSMRICPGCGLEMPLAYRVYECNFNSSPECWSVFEEVLAAEFQNAVLFGQVHQLTVDTYAVQHALRVRQWAYQLWRAWSPHHESVAELAGRGFAVK